MAIGWKVALAAASLACGSSAQAAFITYTIEVAGTGSRTNYDLSNIANTRVTGLQGVVVTVGFNAVEGNVSANLPGDFGSYAQIRAEDPGLRLSFSPAAFGYDLSGSGSICVAGGAPAALPVTGVPILSGCTLAYNLVFPRGLRTESFSGTVTSFTVSSQASGTNFFTIASIVPEPSTWALMLAGFGLVGYSLRRRRTTVAFA